MISSLKLSILLSAMAQVESGGNPHAFNYHEQAYGLLQIREQALKDVNKYRLQSYRLEDAFDPDHARDIAAHYLRIWCPVANRYSFEDAARIYNGGPAGWWKLSTLRYWYRVKTELERRGLDSRDTILETQPNLTQKWQPQLTNPLPAAPSPSTPGTTVVFSLPSGRATPSRFVLNVNAEMVQLSPSFTFTIKPSAPKPAPQPASPPPTSAPAKTPAPAVVFELHWNDTR